MCVGPSAFTRCFVSNNSQLLVLLYIPILVHRQGGGITGKQAYPSLLYWHWNVYLHLPESVGYEGSGLLGTQADWLLLSCCSERRVWLVGRQSGLWPPARYNSLAQQLGQPWVHLMWLKLHVFIVSAGIILITKLYSVERFSWVLPGSTSGHLSVISSTVYFSFSHRPASIAVFIVCSQYPVSGSCIYTIMHKGYMSRVPC